MIRHTVRASGCVEEEAARKLRLLSLYRHLQLRTAVEGKILASAVYADMAKRIRCGLAEQPNADRQVAVSTG